MTDSLEVTEYIIQRRWAEEASGGVPIDGSYYDGRAYVIDPLDAARYPIDRAMKELYKLKDINDPGFYTFVINKLQIILTQVDIRIEEHDESEPNTSRD